MVSTAQTRIRIGLAFLAVYFIWGSTYLATLCCRLYPAFLRSRGEVPHRWYLPSGLGTLERISTFSSRVEIEHYSGCALFPCGAWAFALGRTVCRVRDCIPVCRYSRTLDALIGNIFKQKHTLLDKRTAAGFLIGLVGVVVLAVSSGHMKVASYLGLLAILGSPIAWSAGVVYAKNAPLPRNNVARSGLSLLAGSILLLIVSVLTGEPRRFHPGLVPAISWISLSYLVVFGSLIAFSAYTWLLEHCSTHKVSTYTYVNPIVAVLIGYFVAGEKITSYTIMAGVLVISALLLINLPGRSGRSARKIYTMYCQWNRAREQERCCSRISV